MLGFRRPEFSDGQIDLYPIRIGLPDQDLQFGRELLWRITEHGKKQEIGQISFRNGESIYIYYFGHIGYHIDPPWRGHGYACAACKLISSLFAYEAKSSLVITCDPDNIPSRKTCEKLGCTLERIVDVPLFVRQRYEISAVKCRYIYRIGRLNEPLKL